MADSSVPFPSAVENSPQLSDPALAKAKRQALLESTIGFTLIMATVWTARLEQRSFFWISAGWFLCFALAALWRHRSRLALPPVEFSLIIITSGVAVAATIIAIAAGLGTLHPLFGIKNPLEHAGMYLLWAVIQQWMQQRYFLSRFEQLTSRGLLASFTAATLFAVVHLPNPVLVPITFLGGWILSEIYRRYRYVLPLGIAHGLVGIAIALAVPDSIQHHMRVGLGYLTYPH
ncbi:MAG TPA: CPBP family intramembrane glutamic endopeptidase [Candidatus Angelobacter sp.]|nr:CPBP family intramembrane glutamic endopeptidase [Candidatus Angelobacter sp.]